MFSSLWHRLRDRNPVHPRGNCLRAARHPSYRPRLEPLEDRLVPAWGGGAVASALAPAAAGGLPHPSSTPPTSTTPISVTVAQNSSESVIDLGAAFGAVSGLQHGDGLKLSVLGNTNPGLVSTDLSEAALTLTYARGKYGTATITVCATDADGVSAQQTLLVTVLPLRPAAAVSRAEIPAGSAARR